MKNIPDVSVILPTRNEADNIAKMIDKISEILQKSSLSGEIIIVDDDSSDGTASIAQRCSSYCTVRVFVRKGIRGLATAVMKGFHVAVGHVCVVMDADFSHPVNKIPDLVDPILQDKCDMTIGSRYVSGGDCQDWPFLRKLISRFSGLLAKGVTRLSDPTSGFMAIKKEIVEHADLNPVGWKIVLETAVKLNPRIIEVPIVFTDREQGASKLDGKVQIDYLRHLGRLYLFRFPLLSQFIQFCIVGLSGVLIDTLALVMCVEIFGLGPRTGAVIAFLFAATWNYLLNRIWTFRVFQTRRFSYLSFILISVLGLFIRLNVMHLLLVYAGMDRGRWYIFASMAGIFIASFFNFYASKYISFRSSRTKN